METVALEWISSAEVEPQDVVQLVQRLHNVPEDAVCEIGGEIIQLRCKHVYTGKRIGTPQVMMPASERVDDDETAFESRSQAVMGSFNIPSTTASVLPIDKVIALIDLLGDQVVDAQEAYELFSDRDASSLIASNNVAVERVPTATTVPFLSYTDFLATALATKHP
ncbi:uncharacterized protein PITG_10251 [Phytophthora infestans T30-4]|uniref:Uncharacterized protein n=1 Tax=Phytophthora infestans (strain T30-4) TaxID=403677 RepID=D0NEW5_PHYIT|nr:uncharacterized protein PITG_10251 [Phytophthora infestans T30-4]EEY56754.1 hypothetical protein PITG_10251 [Phytophthora infestans T30-4]|eukprot:XP_002902082.1 hypothetical protein PITG_10251 [Phytophthora infestans T30-4]